MNKTSSGFFFDHALFSGNAMNLERNVTIVGDIGTNDSSISKHPSVTITGDEEINAGINLSPIIFTCSTCVTDKEINSSETWFNGTYEYLNVDMDTASILTISGNVILYVKESFVAQKESKIKLL